VKLPSVAHAWACRLKCAVPACMLCVSPIQQSSLFAHDNTSPASPAQGRRVYVVELLLCLCCVFVFLANLLRVAQPDYLPVCLTWRLERFFFGRGRSGHLLPCPFQARSMLLIASMSTLTSCLNGWHVQ
jgi:hypothetical protein